MKHELIMDNWRQYLSESKSINETSEDGLDAELNEGLGKWAKTAALGMGLALSPQSKAGGAQPEQAEFSQADAAGELSLVQKAQLFKKLATNPALIKKGWEVGISIRQYSPGDMTGALMDIVEILGGAGKTKELFYTLYAARGDLLPLVIQKAKTEYETNLEKEIDRLMETDLKPNEDQARAIALHKFTVEARAVDFGAGMIGKLLSPEAPYSRAGENTKEDIYKKAQEVAYSITSALGLGGSKEEMEDYREKTKAAANVAIAAAQEAGAVASVQK